MIATKAGITPHRRGTLRRLLARRAAAAAGRVAAQARHRLRRPLVRALHRRHRAVRRDAGRARRSGASGKVRYAGVSNYCGWRIGRAATWQRAVPGRAPVVANQMRYSLLDRGVEREVVPGLRRARRRRSSRGRRSAAACSPASTAAGCRPTRARPARNRPLPMTDAPRTAGHRRGGRDGGRRAGHLAGRGRARVAARPSGCRRAGPRRAHARPAHRAAGLRDARPAARDPRRARRRERAGVRAIPRTSTDLASRPSDR